MSLKQKITEDMKTAMRAGDARRRDAIRLLQAAIKQREVDERVVLDDTAVVAVIERMLKQRKDSIAQYEAAGRQDLADVEKYETGILQEYMPQAMSDQEVEEAVREAISVAGARSLQDMGRVMAILKPGLAGRAEMAEVSALVKARLVI